jgi:glucose/arabinose dehydrogenase
MTGPRLLHRPLLATAALLLLAGCGAGATATEPDWRPAPSFQGEGGLPGIEGPSRPQPSQQAPSTAPAPSGAPSSPDQTQQADPAVVATGLAAPVGITLLPDGTALVGERTTGRIVRVQPQPGQPVHTVRTLPGLDTSGDGGLLDLALSPHYSQDKLIFAYVTTATDNRVVAFTLTGPVTPVLTGIPRGQTGNAGRIAFGADGDLYIGTGDAGDPAHATDPASLAGKVLRVTDIGTPAQGNPQPDSPIYSSGHVGLSGLCTDTDSGTVFVIESGAGGGEISVLHADAGYAGTGTSVPPLAVLPAADTAPGGCAVRNAALYIASRDGTELLATPLTTKAGTISAGPFAATLTGRYGRLLTVVAAPDGALWLTTSNRDGHGKPVADDERVLRIVPSGGSARAPV